MLVLLQVLAEEGKPLSELRTRFEPYAQSGEINFEVADKDAAISSIAAAFSGEKDYLDGLTVDLGDRWFNVRPSNTEPVLRLNVEAPTAAEVTSLVEQVAALIEPGTDSGLLPPGLLELMQCPSCGGTLLELEEPPSLLCRDCGLRYPVENGIPVMLIEEATQT
jgi:uncharacterized protein YbaR (Trm112 family)